MKRIILSAPSEASGFLGFTIDGYHSIQDFGIYRVSNGDRYENFLNPVTSDKTESTDGVTGKYLITSVHDNQTFNINIAFDSLTEQKLTLFKRVLGQSKELSLQFDEQLDRVYYGKFSSPSLTITPFEDKNGQRVYKGSGNLQFTAFYPYGIEPDYLLKEASSVIYQETRVDAAPSSGAIFHWVNDKKRFSGGQQYSLIFKTLVPQENVLATGLAVFIYTDESQVGVKNPTGYWRINSEEIKVIDFNSQEGEDFFIGFSGIYQKQGGLLHYEYTLLKGSGELLDYSSPRMGDNNGDVETPFVLTYNGSINNGKKFVVGNSVIEITKELSEGCKLEWDSKTGMVREINKIDPSIKQIVSYDGRACGTIPMGGTQEIFVYDWDNQEKRWVDYLKVNNNEWKKWSKTANEWGKISSEDTVPILNYNYLYY